VRILLDTHVLLWWLEDSARLSETARSTVADTATQLFWSAASSWELAIKVGLGRIRLVTPLRKLLPAALLEQSIDFLAVEQSHALQVAELPHHHRDPFDRMLVAQCRVERLRLLSADEQIRRYDVDVVW